MIARFDSRQGSHVMAGIRIYIYLRFCLYVLLDGAARREVSTNPVYNDYQSPEWVHLSIQM